MLFRLWLNSMIKKTSKSWQSNTYETCKEYTLVFEKQSFGQFDLTNVVHLVAFM